jgi:hypothetical protein
MCEEGNKLEECISSDQKEDEDERILCDNTETQERKSYTFTDTSRACVRACARARVCVCACVHACISASCMQSMVLLCFFMHLYHLIYIFFQLCYIC